MLGLLITWSLWPVEFRNADPSDLRPAIKRDYVQMISAAYELDGDLTSARQRIQALELVNTTQIFDELIAGEKKQSQDSITLDALIHLGQALGLKLPYTTDRPLPGAPTPVTVFVVATPSPPRLAFRLVEHAQLGCADESEIGRLRIFVRDAAGKDLPSIGIEIRSDDVVETIYTGLKPEHGVGYADYEATPGKFSVTILNAESDIVSDLVIGDVPVNCSNDRGKTPRGWKLVFQQK